MLDLSTVIKQLIPCVCKVCDKPSTELICQPCCVQMAVDELACHQCGERIAAVCESELMSPEKRCGRCITKPPAFVHTLFVFRYTGAAARLIQDFKFNEALNLSSFFARVIADKMLAQQQRYPLPDLLLPIPLHPQRLKSRGFNQSFELAKHIARHIDIPVGKQIMTRTRATEQQTGLHRQDRENNIKGAFSLAPSSTEKLRGKRVALVDDVITTGATMREAAKLLTRAKPVEISLLSIAKTQRDAK